MCVCVGQKLIQISAHGCCCDTDKNFGHRSMARHTQQLIIVLSCLINHTKKLPSISCEEKKREKSDCFFAHWHENYTTTPSVVPSRKVIAEKKMKKIVCKVEQLRDARLFFFACSKTCRDTSNFDDETWWGELRQHMKRRRSVQC